MFARSALFVCLLLPRFRQVIQCVEQYSRQRAGILGRSAAHFLVSGAVWAAAASGEPQGGSSQPPARISSEQHKATRPWSLEEPLLCEAMALPANTPICDEVKVKLT